MNAQEYVQHIRGFVTDVHTGISLSGATVILTSSDQFNGTTTDANGRFTISNVPVGRHSIKVSYMGYKPWEANNFIVGTGKEIYFDIKLEESVQVLDEIVIRHRVDKEKPLNEMATVSARMFTIEETNRYAGSIGDPARMASNFAGVNTLNDQNNDIVIRGNSPFGLLLNLEGVDIPNPNHFGAQGATGGPISMLNNNVLANSDFLTGAFPAQFGNALSGVFDLGMRQGNTAKYEFLGQVAFNGLEAGVEGPISKKNHTSFLANYRYSTIGLLDNIYGIDKLALLAVPYFQDMNFNATLYRGKAGSISVFGLGGYNFIEINEDIKDPSEWTNHYFGNKTRNETWNGTAGIKHRINPSNSFMLETTLAATYMSYRFKSDTLTTNNKSLSPQHRLINEETTLFASARATWKINPRNILWAGASWQPMNYTFLDSLYRSHSSAFITRYNLTGDYTLGKTYVQWRHNFTDQLTISNGINIMYFSGNSQVAIDPRIGIGWMFLPGQSISLASGIHSHLAPRIYYVSYNSQATEENSGNHFLNFTRSVQLVAGYDRKFGLNTRLKLETYYQYHFKVPVMESIPAWSLLNVGAEWIDFITPSEPLANKGTGDNYGVEVTLEKFFSEGFYYLFTASVFDSKYKGYDGISRNTAFNGNYIFNTLAGKEFRIKSRNVLSLDAKLVWAGGKPYLPFTTMQVGEFMHLRVDDWENAYALKRRDYFRINLRIGYRINLMQTTHELAVDIYNLTNRQNIFMEYFDPVSGDIRTMYQFSFLPVLLYRVTF